jgi:uridine kinase
MGRRVFPSASSSACPGQPDLSRRSFPALLRAGPPKAWGKQPLEEMRRLQYIHERGKRLSADKAEANGAGRVVIGIGGGTGAGKTTLARQIARQWTGRGVTILDLDSYYHDREHLSPAERALVNYDEPDAIDFELLREHLKTLIQGESIAKPKYCFATHSREAARETTPAARILIVEGLLTLWDAPLRGLMTLKIYVDADADLRFIRRLERDTRERGRTAESVAQQYLTTVRPMHLAYIEPTRAHADLIMNGAGWEGENWAQLEARMTTQLAPAVRRI